MKAEVEASAQAAAAAEKGLQEASDEETERQMKVGEVKALYDEAKDKLQELEERMASCSSELSRLQHDKTILMKKAEVNALEAKKLSVAISRIEKEKSNAEKLVATLLKKNAWIESERSAFGVAGGDYDFEATDPGEMGRQLSGLKAEQDSLVSTKYAYISLLGVSRSILYLTFTASFQMNLRARRSTKRLWG